MAALTLPVEDSSALIHYEPAGAWTNPTNNDDPLALSYSGASFHSTTTQGATATINFNGTGINVFAGTRPNYGSFQLKIDGKVVFQGQSSSGQPEFNKLIASSTGLSNGPHTAVFENVGGSQIDLDKVDILTELGLPGATLETTSYDDTHPSVTYLPSLADWSINNAQGFMNNTLHFTNNSQAAVSFTWDDGEAFAIWTTAAPDHRNFQLTLDGQPLETCKAGSDSVKGLRPNVLMHYHSGLTRGQHTLVMTGTDGGPFLDLDSIQVFSTSGGSSSSAQGSRRLSVGLIAGIAVGALVGLLLLIALVLFLLRRAGRSVALSPWRRSSPDPRTDEPSKDLEAGIGPDYSTANGLPSPMPKSTTSSFFALEQDVPDDSSMHSRTPMVPPLPVAYSQSRMSRSHIETPSATSDGGAYFTSFSGTQHQSVHLEVEMAYPVVK